MPRAESLNTSSPAPDRLSSPAASGDDEVRPHPIGASSPLAAVKDLTMKDAVDGGDEDDDDDDDDDWLNAVAEGDRRAPSPSMPYVEFM